MSENLPSTMKQEKIQESDITQFYETTTNVDQNFCEHKFKRLSPTRILCPKCGLGFFDDPFDPFPVEEMNKKIKQEKKNKKVAKN